jgi:hypothetical protein
MVDPCQRRAPLLVPQGHQNSGGIIMRVLSNRDLIAWTLLAATLIVFVASTTL